MTSTQTQPDQQVEARRSGSFGHAARTVLQLVIAATALLVFIGFLGDIRRKQNMLAQMQWHADTYIARMGDTPKLPLNFDPEIPPARQPVMLKVEWISRNDARVLRKTSESVITTFSTPLPLALGRDGRVVCVFESGAFRIEWMDIETFDGAMARQRARIAESTDRP